MMGRMAITAAVWLAKPCEEPGAAIPPLNNNDKLPLPAACWSSTAAESIVTSLMRYTASTRNAFVTGARRSWKNATSSAELRSTNSQPMNNTWIFPASATSSTFVTNISQEHKIPVVADLTMEIAVRKCRHNVDDCTRQGGKCQRPPVNEEFDRDATLVGGRPVAIRK